MKSNRFQSFRLPRHLPSVVLLICLTPRCGLAQTQAGADAPSGGANQSWTATTQQQLPSSLNPTRTSESHTEANGRIVDNKSIEKIGMDGRYSPYLDLQKETVKVDAHTVRTIERAFGRDSDGRKALVQVTEEEKRTLPGGEVKVMRSTSNPDANGVLQVVQRELQDTRQISPTVQETKSTRLTPSSNGGLAESMQSMERETKHADHSIDFRTSTSLPDANGTWQVNEVREGTIKEDGKNRTKEERVLRPGTDGNLSLVERTVTKESGNVPGETRATVETYSNNLPGVPIDGSLHLDQRVTTVRRLGRDGAQSTDKQVEQRNPAQPSDSLRLTEQAIDIVRPGAGGTRETQTIRSLDSNGSLGVVSVDTRKQDNSAPIQVKIAPSKTGQPAPGH